MRVTPRTAGFNTVDYGATADSTNFVTILLMSIGGSPGSTAGGLKTTTVAVIGLLALARLRGHQVTSVQGRTIPEETVQRAVGLFVVGFVVVTGGILLYAVVQLVPVGSAERGAREVDDDRTHVPWTGRAPHVRGGHRARPSHPRRRIPVCLRRRDHRMNEALRMKERKA